MDYRNDGCRLLRGRGIEIGALHAPVALSPALQVEYCDIMDRDTAIDRYPEILPSRLVDPQHIVDVDREGLARFADDSLDFAIANMVVGNVANPIRLIGELFRVVRPGGHVVLSAADKRFTYDRDRPSTPFERLLQAWQDEQAEPEDEQYLELLATIDIGSTRGPARSVAAAIRRARKRREPVHVWDGRQFTEFLARSRDLLGIRADCVYEREGAETGVEHFSIWQVRAPNRTMISDQPEGASPEPETIAEIASAATSPRADDPESVRGPLGVAPGSQAKPVESGRGVLLLGMHRSGTSLVARLLADAGLHLGEDSDLLAASAEDNPDGYWERQDVLEAHDAFLRDIGMTWNRVAGLSEQHLQLPSVAPLENRLCQIVSTLRSPWLIKDPRLCLLLPVWNRIGVDYAPLVVIRHPLEIAGSLARSPRGIFPIQNMLALWEKYLLRALSALAGRPAVFVSYARLLANPAVELGRVVDQLTRLGVAGLSVPDAALLAERIKPGLRRQRSDEDPDGILTNGQRALWQELTTAASADQPVKLVTSLAEPDKLLAEFQSAYDYFREQGRNLGRAEHPQQLAELQDTSNRILEQVRARQDVLEREAADLREWKLTQEAVLHDLRERLAIAVTRSEQMQLTVDAVAEREHSNADELAAHAQSLADMRRSLSWRVTAPLRWAAGAVRAPRLSWRMEQRLYKLYYGIPGISHQRKRAFVLWLHRSLPFLTRSTRSYALYKPGVRRSNEAPAPPRMDATRAKALIEGLSRRPRFSIIMPVYNTDRQWLHDAIESLKAQYYDNWELCIVDDCSGKAETLEYLAQLDDPRIRQQRMETNQGIARTTNAALAMATGEYIGLLDHDDVLTRDALLENVLVLQDESIDLIYSDEDKMDVGGDCHGPVYKPDYSPDYLFANNYFCHFTVFSRSLCDAVGGLHYGYDGAQDFDLVLRLSEKAQRIHHIPKVLYHWRMVPSSTAAAAGAKPYTWEAGRRALTDALARREIVGRVDLGPYPNTYHVRRDVVAEPLVSIVIPFRDESAVLRKCVESILQRSTWQRYELLLVNNQSQDPATHRLLEELAGRDSRIRVVHYDQPFNYSALHNWAVPQVRGDMLLLLNNDTEVISDDWIESLVEHAQRPEVAVVGCKLLYPDETIQHAGVIVGIGSFAGHAHHLSPADHPGYMARPHLLQNVSAVTFACAMMRTRLYSELGGMDENNLAVAYNDVDFCLRALEAGYLNVYTPHAELYHYESRTRGSENDPAKQRRFAAETQYMHQRHRGVIERGDRFYNINFPGDGNSYDIDPGYTSSFPV